MPGSATPSPRCYALVPCAGVGARAATSGPKQYAAIAGRAMVAHTLDALLQVDRIEAVLVVLARDDAEFERKVPDFVGWIARCGGATRAETVSNGIDELLARGARVDDWVLVHDAARCLIEPDWVERLIEACVDDAVGGLLAMPLADTLKQERGGRAVATVARSDKWIAQTPQMFRLGALKEALVQAGKGVTDEASAFETRGQSPKLVLGDARNFKITWPGDFVLAEKLLRR